MSAGAAPPRVRNLAPRAGSESAVLRMLNEVGARGPGMGTPRLTATRPGKGPWSRCHRAPTCAGVPARRPAAYPGTSHRHLARAEKIAGPRKVFPGLRSTLQDGYFSSYTGEGTVCSLRVYYVP